MVRFLTFMLLILGTTLPIFAAIQVDAKEWAKYLVSKNAPLDTSDAKALFELARGLEQELTKLQAEETTQWVAEFNTGTSVLDTLIKTQREETDKS